MSRIDEIPPGHSDMELRIGSETIRINFVEECLFSLHALDSELETHMRRAAHIAFLHETQKDELARLKLRRAALYGLKFVETRHGDKSRKPLSLELTERMLAYDEELMEMDSEIARLSYHVSLLTRLSDLLYQRKELMRTISANTRNFIEN